jgi:hypothetical protein
MFVAHFREAFGFLTKKHQLEFIFNKKSLISFAHV